MKALLDTHIFLWWIMDDKRLNQYVHDFIADEGNDLFLSVASCWEIVIKTKLGKLKLPDNPIKFIPHQMSSNKISGLPVQLVHALSVYNLPSYHRDPFDRIIIAQSQVEKIPVITNDPNFTSYNISILWNKSKRRETSSWRKR